MSDEKIDAQTQPVPEGESQPTPQAAAKRTSPKGVIATFIIVALFLGALCGYIGGYIAGRVSSERGFEDGRGGYMMRSGGQSSPWGSNGPGMMQEQGDGSSSSDSGSST